MSAPDPWSVNTPPEKPPLPATPGEPTSCWTQGAGSGPGVGVLVGVLVFVGVRVGGAGVSVFVGVKVGPEGVGVFVAVRVGVFVGPPENVAV